MTPIYGVATSSPRDTAVAGSAERQKADTDMFLRLLVTQLRYQNPLSAGQDTGDLLTQLSLFTLLEQVVKMNEAFRQQGLLMDRGQALALLNQTVELALPDGTSMKGRVTAVDLSSSRPTITVNGEQYPYDSVVKVEGGHG